ncbi:MAG: hypothetical protein NVS3B5_17150 [Sphingomicrobium sp.]
MEAFSQGDGDVNQDMCVDTGFSEVRGTILKCIDVGCLPAHLLDPLTREFEEGSKRTTSILVRHEEATDIEIDIEGDGRPKPQMFGTAQRGPIILELPEGQPQLGDV